MEQLFFAGKAYLKINSLVKTPLHEFMAVERSGLRAPGLLGRTIEKVMGERAVGNLEPREFFFVIKFLHEFQF